MEIGINWWQSDPNLNSLAAREDDSKIKKLSEKIEKLEESLARMDRQLR